MALAFGAKSTFNLPKGKSGANWSCKSCGNANYADREACNMCKESRDRSQWRCKSCDNWNWLDRDACNLCKAPQDDGVDEPDQKRPRREFSLPQGRSQGPSWCCKGCRNDNFADRMACNRCHSDRSDSQWLCTECDNYNYLDRTECNRCHVPVDPQAAAAHGSSTQEQVENDAASLVQAIQSFDPTFNGDQYFRPDGYDVTGLLRELEQKISGVRARHGPRRTAGHVTIHPRRFPVMQEIRPQPQQFGVGGPMNRVAQKPGSWECGGCQNWNFADRELCNRCQQPKMQQKPIFRNQADISSKPGSWECSACPNQWNFPDRDHCNKCKRPRAEVELGAQGIA
eukprot:GEMP01026381.1.p1 GENE.GEMP01026381.1~~GEMP01026381.1.p1  ORF type:complete len:356 (+),score=63.40 GEMP01026381.1:47-1069(+)